VYEGSDSAATSAPQEASYTRYASRAPSPGQYRGSGLPSQRERHAGTLIEHAGHTVRHCAELAADPKAPHGPSQVVDPTSFRWLDATQQIFDAEAPYTPRGCIAQAWSVAEELRCWVKTAE
jgi:Amylo-alpha-1,6-glucosidase